MPMAGEITRHGAVVNISGDCAVTGDTWSPRGKNIMVTFRQENAISLLSVPAIHSSFSALGKTVHE